MADDNLLVANAVLSLQTFYELQSMGINNELLLDFLRAANQNHFFDEMIDQLKKLKVAPESKIHEMH